VFNAQETAPGGRLMRTIGIVRAHVKIGLENFVYNPTLERMAAACQPESTSATETSRRVVAFVARRAVQRQNPRHEPSAVIPLAGIYAKGDKRSPSDRARTFRRAPHAARTAGDARSNPQLRN
jgi:hypothetical protein